MADKHKRIVLFVALVSLGIVLSTPSFRIGVFTPLYNTPLEKDDILSAEEVNSFLEVYIDIKRTSLSSSVVSLSLSKDNKFPARVERWFKAKGWSAGRYFTVEQRIRKLMSIAVLLNNLEANRKLKGSVNQEGINDIIKQQEQQLGSLIYNEQELELIRNNLFQLNQLLEADGN